MFHMKHEHRVVVDRLDDLVRRSQELSDLYVRWCEQGQRSGTEDEVAACDQVLQALTWVWLSSRASIGAVAADLLAADIIEYDWDF